MNVITDYLRSQKAAMLRECYQRYDTPAEARITDVAAGRIVPGFAGCSGETLTGVVGDDGLFVADSHVVDNPEEIENRAAELTFEEVDQTVVYLGMFSSHWGHFITDCLSTFWFLGSLDADRYVFSYYQGQCPEISGNIRLALDLLGVLEKIEIVSEPRRYSRVFVPRKGMIPGEYTLKECGSVYDSIIAEGLRRSVKDYDGCKQIFLSRSRFPKAIQNEPGMKEVEQLFVGNGYEPVCPENISLIELISRLSSAEEIASFSGTPPHNLLFAPRGSHLIVLEKYADLNNYQQGIDRLRDLDVTYVDAAFFVWSVDPGLGPFLLGYTSKLQSFAADRRFRLPERKFNAAKMLRRFFRVYYRHYKRRWILHEWQISQVSLFKEAYDDSLTEFEPWLSGKKPIFLLDFLRPRYIAKRLWQLFH